MKLYVEFTNEKEYSKIEDTIINFEIPANKLELKREGEKIAIYHLYDITCYASFLKIYIHDANLKKEVCVDIKYDEILDMKLTTINTEPLNDSLVVELNLKDEEI